LIKPSTDSYKENLKQLLNLPEAVVKKQVFLKIFPFRVVKPSVEVARTGALSLQGNQ
jgi:hypothetical protein